MNVDLSHSLIDENELITSARSLSDYVSHLRDVVNSRSYTADEAFLSLVEDENLLNDVMETVSEKKTDRLKHVVVIGVGGSSLGTAAIYEALSISPGDDHSQLPRLHFLDTNDPEELSRFLLMIDREVTGMDEVLINTVSKSGQTTETIANTEFVLGHLKKRFERVEDRLVVTTSPESPLWDQAQCLGVTTLAHPEKVGGRFSVFSVVGMFPLALVGVDIKALHDGARAALLSNISEDCKAALSATALYLSSKRGITQNVNFTFHPELESVGKWYRQLMSESVGKREDLEGNQVFAGITPSVSVGSTDLHSMLQLYIAGPRDKITTFISSRRSQQGPKVESADDRVLPGVVDMIDGLSASEIMIAILNGVKNTYVKEKLPFVDIQLDDLSEKSLGEFMQFKMLEIVYLAKLLNVNAFNQPNVEMYKNETRNILEKK